MSLTRPRMKILIPIDWSDKSLYAFNWYLQHLHASDTFVVLVHFIDANNDRELQSKEMKLKELQDQYENLLLENKVNYTWRAGSSKSAGEYIIECALEEEVNLVVMGCRNMGRLRKTLMKSISDFLIEKSPVPVIICKSP